MSWLLKLLGKDGSTQVDANSYSNSLNVSLVSRGERFSIETLTGTIGAASNGAVFVMRNDPGTTKRIYITQIVLDYTTIVAYTTPVTQRRLVLSRGSGAASSGGTDITPIKGHASDDPVIKSDSANGGSTRVATTAVLTVTGITFEAQNFGQMVLTQFGAANARLQQVYDFGSTDRGAIALLPGECFAIRTAGAFDAAGTWQLGTMISAYQK